MIFDLFSSSKDKTSAKRKRYMKRRTPVVGLALGSGVARGIAHIGVLKAMEAEGIKPDVVVGTSMGAVAGAAYVTGNLDDLQAWVCNLDTLRMLRDMDVDWSGSGLLQGEKITTHMTNIFGDKKIEDLDIPFAAVATDLLSGHEVWLREGSIVDALRASISLPGLFKPVQREGRWLVDGALVNPVPVSVCAALGADFVIAVDVNGDLFRAKMKRLHENDGGTLSEDLGRAVPGGTAEEKDTEANNFFARVLGSGGPNVTSLRAVAASMNILLDRVTRSRLAGDPPDMLVVPKIGNVGLAEFDRAEELIEKGETAFREALGDFGGVEALGGAKSENNSD